MSTNINSPPTFFTKISEIALKYSPLFIIVYAIYNLSTSVLGYMTVEEQSDDYKEKFKSRMNAFIVGIVASLLVIFLTSIHTFNKFFRK
jgi:hypothetical protein